MKFGSLFSGVGGFDLGFERAGMECSWQCEIDKHATTVLEKQWSKVKRYADVREIGKRNLEPIELICGGFPCQDLSVAGKRKGLAGERSGLWWGFARIIDELEPKWVVAENVPGLLSSNKGKDFAFILRWLVERGYGVSWRILDSQYFGVPQRRKRVFIVGSFRSGGSAEVLFEQESLSGNIAEVGAEGETATETFTIRSGKDGGGKGYLGSKEKAMKLSGQEQHLFRMVGFGDYVDDDKVGTLKQRDYKDSTDLVWEQNRIHLRGKGESSISPTLQERMGTGGGQVPCVGVRRFTPVECERLQGFPDGWTECCSDSQRYRQMGNAVTVNVAEWIGKRIMRFGGGESNDDRVEE
jgi:DNA (cytosine-5)-methyltransferase 1